MALKKIHPGAEISISSSLTFQVFIIFIDIRRAQDYDMNEMKHSCLNLFVFIGHSIVQETRVLQAILQF